MAFIEPCFGIGHNLSLICQMTSEDIKHQLIIIKEKVIGSWPGTCIQYTRLQKKVELMQTKLCFPAIPAQTEGKVTARALTKTRSIAAKHFTVLADEVTDQQLSLVFSFVDGDINIREDFIACFVCLFVCLFKVCFHSNNDNK